MTTDLFPFRSSEGYTRAGELIARGSWSVNFPDEAGNAKPEGYQLEELLWEMGRSQTLRINELQDAHDAIPETISPRIDATLGDKTGLAARVRVLLARLQSAEAALSGLQAARCYECGANISAMCLSCNPEVEALIGL